MIKKIETAADRVALVDVLRRSFGTVARDYGLTETNAPTNPAFTTSASIGKYMEKPVEVFGLFVRERMVGCIAIEPSKSRPDLYYVERLGVLPEERHQGHGDALLSHALRVIKDKGGVVASLGIIAKNKRLKRWYLSKGFIETEQRTFRHLPFEVCFMSKDLANAVHG